MIPTGSILVIDDELAIAGLIVEFLTDEGYVVYSALNSADAATLIAQNPPRLILLDLGHPTTPGTALIGQVRAASRATIPLVLMTTAPHKAAPLLVPGAIECLAKPFDLSDLLACVARYVRPDQATAQALAN